MKIQQMIHLEFNVQEVKEGLTCILDGKRNCLLPTDPEFDRLSKLIEAIQDGKAELDYDGDRFFLVFDGLFSEEDIDLLG